MALTLAVISLAFIPSAAGVAFVLSEAAPKMLERFKGGPLKSLADRFASLSIQWEANKVVTMAALSCLLSGLLLMLALGSFWGFLLGAVLGALLPSVLLKVLERRRRERFAGQLAECLDLLGNALRSGQSLQQGLATLSTEAPEPSKSYWGEISSAVRLGKPAEEALERLAADFRKQSAETEILMLATAVAVNRSVGGNLAETFTQLAEMIRERARLREQVEALTAQGKLSGWIVGLLPVVLLAALNILEPDMLDPLFHTTQGWGLMGAGLALELMGAFFIKRIVEIDF